MAFPTKSASNSGIYFAGAAAAVIFIAFVSAAMLYDRSAVLVYLRDPAAHFKFSPFAGVISHLGVLATFGSAAICIFVSFHAKTEAALLRAVGLFGLLLALDDLFMLHEDTLPIRLGLPEYLAYAVYGGIVLLIAGRYWATLRAAPLGGLYLAITLMAVSVAVDALTMFGNKQTVIEDGLKFVGLIVWSVYWIGRAGTAFSSQK